MAHAEASIPPEVPGKPVYMRERETETERDRERRHVPHFRYLFIRKWTPRMFTLPSYCEQSNTENERVYISL